MNATVTWRQGLSFTGKADTGFEVPLGADPEVGGANDGFRPLELMAVSLAGCTAMDVISILTKKKQDVTAFEVKVHAEQAEEFPKVFTQAVITYLVTGLAVDEAAVLRAIELTATKYCPAQAMLGKVVPMELVYEIYEDEGSGKTRLARQGKYQPQSV
ncbi:MAG: OsmC family protein [Candidatus Atribacteria bacterium]|nr:OsmC family protein [Candidatus Atribacteria bacterium]